MGIRRFEELTWRMDLLDMKKGIAHWNARGLDFTRIFHMPAGQSGHPLSPHYADGHAAWANGERTPFLPGPPASVLTLAPPR